MKWFQLVSVVLGLACAAAYGTVCEERLVSAPALTLPREFKLSTESLEFLLRSPEHRSQLELLSRVFAVLTSPDMDLEELIKALRENENLKDMPLANALDAADLATFESLARKSVPFIKDRLISHGASRDEMNARSKSEAERLRILFSHVKYREAIASLLSVPRARAEFIAMWNRVGKMSGARPVNEKSLDLLIGRTLKARDNRELIVMLSSYFCGLTVDLIDYGRSLGIAVNGGDTRFGMDGAVYKRQEFLQALGPYLAEQLQVKSSIDDMTDALDFFIFGTPLPPTPNQFYQAVVDGAKETLLPMKAEYSRYVAEIARQKQQGPTLASGAPFELKLVDLFEPTGAVRLRVSKDSERLDVAAERIEQDIPYKLALREFTSFTSNPRPLADLRGDVVYEFWFLRESHVRKQRLRLSASVLDWFQRNENSGRQFLNALHLGAARLRGQNGIKALFGRSTRYKGTVYELKSFGGYRGLMLKENGVWELVSIVTKEEQDRAIEFMRRPESVPTLETQ